MYEVLSAPAGRTFYFDGLHWHLHHQKRAPHLEMRTVGCPGTHWRDVFRDAVFEEAQP